MSRPNIFIFMTDHQRADSVFPYNRAITPNVDKLAKKGVTFDRAFCSAPHCCPSRATFFTGQYPSQHGVWNNVDVGNTLSPGLNNGTRLFSQDMSEAGYTMEFVGKWHVSSEEGPEDRGWNKNLPPYNMHSRGRDRRERPNAYEWDTVYINMDKRDDSPRGEGEIIRSGYPQFTLYGNAERDCIGGVVGHDEGVLIKALDAVRNRDTDKPWCSYVGMLGPHDPYYVPQSFIDMYDIDDIVLPDNYYDTMEDKPALYRRTQDRFSQLTDDEHRQCILRYLAFCTYEDYLFGLIMDEMKAHGQLENTIVLYVSDHGDYLGEHALWAKGLPCFNGAYHVPAIFGDYGTGIIKNPGRIEHHRVGLWDMADTMLELSETENNLDTVGDSLVPFLKGESVEWNDDVFTQTNGNEIYGIQRSVVSGKWRYTFNTFDYDELYDIENDPGEMNNLINDEKYADVVRDMCNKMWKFAKKTGDVCINPYIMTSFAPHGPGIIFED